MVDVTYQMVLSTLQTVGLLVGIFYYIMTLRNTSRNQQLTLETRRMQIIMDIDQEMKSFETYKKIIELINMEWEDYDDFERKYGSDNNPENFAKRFSLLYRLNSIGILVKDGFFDVDTVYDLLGEVSSIWLWKKFEPIIKETRIRYNVPTALSDFEFLYNELIKVREQKGFSVPVTETFAKYIPDSNQ
jgi:hypothetical protein